MSKRELVYIIYKVKTVFDFMPYLHFNMAMLLPYINEQFNGVIWRMEIDSITDTVFLEIRNTADKQVSFASINLNTGHINFKNLTRPERWLTGIEAAYQGILLLHQYQSASSPAHKGVIAVDGVTGTELWSNYIYAFDSITTGGAVLYNTQLQPKKLFVTNVKTGATLKAFEPLKDTVPDNYITTADILPLSSLPPQLDAVTPVGDFIHSVYFNNYRIVSLHMDNTGALNQNLFIINNNQTVYEDILNADIQKMQPEAFILHKNHLLYIKNKSKIKAITL